MYKYILFDLDGTVTDPGVGITNSVMYALKKFDIEVTEREKLYKFIGPPLQDSFRDFYGFDEEKSETAVSYYREYYREKGIYENELYDGMRELFCELKAKDKKIILATSKPEVFAKQILEYFRIDDFFDFVAGATMDGTRGKKSDIISYAIKECHIEDTKDAIMVGDRNYDVLGAASAGLDTIGVTFGYGSKEELSEAGAKYFADKPLDILKFV